MKGLLVITIVLTGLVASACGGSDPATQSPSVSPVVLKVSVLRSGKVLADGTPVSLKQLDTRLAALKEANGEVWYYREDPEADPTPAMDAVITHVVDLMMKYRRDVSFSSRPDFSDYIDAEGNSHPRQ